jgi:SPP1 family predicted phage head-tail adaptor
VKAGALRERLTFQARTLDANGDPLGEWAEQFTVSASAKPLVGGEDVMAARLTGKQPYLFTVRASSQSARITTDWRFMWGGVAFNIRACTLNAKRDGYDILADSGGASG